MNYSDFIKRIEDEDPEAALAFCRQIEEALYVIPGDKDSGKLKYTENARVVERFLGCLFTNQIMILSGPPGTGKTSLPFSVAGAIGAECVLIPVQPNWTDNQDLMGYYNPMDGGSYVTTPFLEALLKAQKNKKKMYFVVLDEMNLAHIEYYFSTFLSVMESAEKKLKLYSGTQVSDVPGEVVIPDNLQIIGTLNMDETTKGVSPKVIDRSYILEIGGERAAINGQDTDLMMQKDYSDFFRDTFHVNLSYRALKHYKAMANRRFMSCDDYVCGKILPMIRENSIDLGKGIETCPISYEKISRMEITGSFEENKKYNFWN